MRSGNNRSHTNAIQVTQSCFKNTGRANYSTAESNFLCHCNPQEQVKIKCYSNHSHINLLYQSHNSKPSKNFKSLTHSPAKCDSVRVARQGLCISFELCLACILRRNFKIVTYFASIYIKTEEWITARKIKLFFFPVHIFLILQEACNRQHLWLSKFKMICNWQLCILDS